ncbi:MAG: type VII toxin-antitoxin system HepT family RNase toxin [Betaproteobacteria bacterium]
MTDVELIEKKLAFVETCVRELRTLATPALILTDLREERFAAHTLQIAVQAALDVASHIVSDERLGEPDTNRQLFDLLARAGWMPPALTVTMYRMAGFRNVVVHGYQALDKAILADIVANRLGDLLDFVAAIRQKLKHPPTQPV